METITSVNYFQARLFSHISESFPYLLSNKEELKEILIAKSNSAKSVYIKSRSMGKEHYYAMEDAMEELYSGFTFSPCDYIRSQLYEKYQISNGDITDEELIKLYYECKHIFDSYGTLFEGENSEFDVIKDLTPYLENYVSKRKTNK